MDWQHIEHHLFEESKRIISAFAREYPEIVCSFFAFDADPCYGYFHVCFDSYENSVQAAKQNEQEAIDRRKNMLQGTTAWKHAKYFSSDPRVTDYSPDVGYFAHHMYQEVSFQEMEDLGRSDDYPQREEHEDDYLEGNTRIVLWKVIERLIADHAFDQLHLTSPFRVGYQLHDQELVVLRILNWPL